MFNFLKKQPKTKGETLRLQISGMHCTSCALTIDGTLEDTPGVVKAQTSYAKSEVMVEFDPTKLDPAQIKKSINNLGYQVIEK